jgi:hypothetical protein
MALQVSHPPWSLSVSLAQSHFLLFFSRTPGLWFSFMTCLMDSHILTPLGCQVSLRQSMTSNLGIAGSMNGSLFSPAQFGGLFEVFWSLSLTRTCGETVVASVHSLPLVSGLHTYVHNHSLSNSPSYSHSVSPSLYHCLMKRFHTCSRILGFSQPLRLIATLCHTINFSHVHAHDFSWHFSHKPVLKCWVAA